MSEQEQGTTSAFGTDPIGAPTPDFLSDYEEAPEAPEAPLPQEPEQPPLPELEATPDTEPEVTEDEAVPEAPVAGADHRLPPELIEQLGGRFEGKSLTDIIAAFRNQEGWTTRVSQERSDFERKLAEVEQKYSTERQQVAPLLQWVNRQIEDGNIDPQELAQYLPQQTPVQEQPSADPYVAAQTQHAINTFAQAHPEAVNDPSVDAGMTRIIKTFRYDPDTGQSDDSEFPLTPENLEIAYKLLQEPTTERVAHELQFIPSDDEDLELLREASANPRLLQVLKVNPNYLIEDGGAQAAREYVRIAEGYSQAAERAPAAASAQTEEMKRRAHVERGGSGAPSDTAPGKVAPDDMDASQLWDAVRERAQADKGNVFGI